MIATAADRLSRLAFLAAYATAMTKPAEKALEDRSSKDPAKDIRMALKP